MKNRKKLYYSSGLISLILLPLLCVLHFDRLKVFERQGVMEVIFSRDPWNEYDDMISLIFGRSHPRRFPPKREFAIINIDGSGDDGEQIRKGQLELRDLVLRKDTINGIRFHFTETSKYNELVRVLDICAIEGPTHYVPYQDDIWVYNQVLLKDSVREESSYAFCGTGRYRQSIIVGDDNYDPIKKVGKEFWVGELLFGLMITCTIVTFVKKEA